MKKLIIVAVIPYPSNNGINTMLKPTLEIAPNTAVIEIIPVLLILSILWRVPEIADIKNATNNGKHISMLHKNLYQIKSLINGFITINTASYHHNIAY